ncbi:MAG: hypothetical protein DCE90_15890 [Pseudanabaena sp.]|nr:MAG: hypothetical protein DCE90_15890 [Pseudanabaena sp.]
MQDQITEEIDLGDRFAPSPEVQTEDRKVYDYALDGLRGIAALWVAYAHIFFFNFKIDPAYHPTLPIGYFFNAAHGGVLIFFALSGYVIGLTNRLPFSQTNAIRYVLRRFIRLYPIYVLAIILGTLSYPVDTWKTIVGSFFFLQVAVSGLIQGNGVLWTLNYEVVYYLVFLAVWYFRPKVIPLMFCSLVIACVFPFIPAIPSIISGYAAGWIFWLFGLWLAWKKPRSEEIRKFPLVAYMLIFIATDKLSIVKTLLEALELTKLNLAQINITDFVYLPLCLLLFSALTQRRIPCVRWLNAIAIALPLAHTTYLLVIGQQYALFGGFHLALGIALWGWRSSPDIFHKFTFFGSISYGVYVLHMPIMNFMSYVPFFSGSVFSFIVRVLIWAGLTIGISYLLELKLQPIIKNWFQQKVLNHV